LPAAAGELRSLVGQLQAKLGSEPGVVALFGREGDKVPFLLAVNATGRERGLAAGDLVKRIAPSFGARGGGKADVAQGAGTDPADERFTTTVATRALREAGVRAKQQRAVIDQAAAVGILQTYLDAARRERAQQLDEHDPAHGDRHEHESDASKRRGDIGTSVP